MLKFLGRNRARVAALLVAVGIVSAASAVSFYNCLTIVAPQEVVAGNTIDGYTAGFSGYCSINFAITGPFPIIAPPAMGVCDPMFFSYPTIEPMAPGIANIHARDSDESKMVSVCIK